MATQGERRAETRQRLLDAAADLFATRGIEASSVDAIAEAADRTSGAIYDHFGDGVDGAGLDAASGEQVSGRVEEALARLGSPFPLRGHHAET